MKYFVLIFALALVLLSGCAPESEEPPAGGVTLANPFTDCANMATAQGGAGFEMEAPTQLGEYQRSAIRVMKGYMIELIYTNSTDEIRVRKAVGEGDISGDYNSYPESGVFSLSGTELTMKGDGAGNWRVATWCREGYSYSVTANADHSREFMLQLAATIN